MDIDTDSETLAASGVRSPASASSSIAAAARDKSRLATAAVAKGELSTAIQLYDESLQIQPDNAILLANRSAVLSCIGQQQMALDDAVSAQRLRPEWYKAYYRQGVALQCMDRHEEAIAAFSQALALQPRSDHLIDSMVEAAMKSQLKPLLEYTYSQLQAMRLDRSAFVVMSVIGQELLAAGANAPAILVLDAALRVGTSNLRLRGSVLSALSSAYWAINSLDKAMSYMQQDLSVAKSLGDTAGECRAHGNLGSALFSKGNYKEALTAHRYQLVLAMKCKDTNAAASALTCLGHVYSAIGDYPNALASHQQCVQLLRQLADQLPMAREIGNVGTVHLALGDFDSAVDCHLHHLRLAKQLDSAVEQARAFTNLASAHHRRNQFEQATVYHQRVLDIGRRLGDRQVEARAYSGLGHAARCSGQLVRARGWHEKQLEVALAGGDRQGEGRACANLGIVYQQMGDHDAALKLHQSHLAIARSLHDRAGMGRAYGNMGNAYSGMGYYDQAITYHKQELAISREVNDRSSEAATHGNLAAAYQALRQFDTSLMHHLSHLAIARELCDAQAEACALANLGSCHSARGQLTAALPYYEQYLLLSQQLQNVVGEARACHYLGYVQYCLGRHAEAVRWYDQALVLAAELNDMAGACRAHCNLGLAHLALGNLQQALDSQQRFLAVASKLQQSTGVFRALGNIGDVLARLERLDEAVGYYLKQLSVAKSCSDRQLEAGAHSSLGTVHRHLLQYDKALAYHTQELTIRQELSDLSGECRAHASLGTVHIALGNLTLAIKCHQEELDRAGELGSAGVHTRAQAHGHLGAALIAAHRHHDAIAHLDEQLSLLRGWSSDLSVAESRAAGGGSGVVRTEVDPALPAVDAVVVGVGSTSTIGASETALEQARCHGQLAECLHYTGDICRAVHHLEQCVTLLSETSSLETFGDQQRAYGGLASCHLLLGNGQQALVCAEKRLVLAADERQQTKRISSGTVAGAKAGAYGQLARVHVQLGNHEQALACLEHQLSLSEDMNDAKMQTETANALGTVHRLLNQLPNSVSCHQRALRVAESANNITGQTRALAGLTATAEAEGRLSDALGYAEQQLQLALTCRVAGGDTLCAEALSNLGRLERITDCCESALSRLQQALALAESVPLLKLQVHVHYQLGQLLWKLEQLPTARDHLLRVVQLVEELRYSPTPVVVATGGGGDGFDLGWDQQKMHLFDEQTSAYQSLERILVSLGQYEEALLAVEQCRSRPLQDLLMKRSQSNSPPTHRAPEPITFQDLESIVSAQRSCVLYYSVAGQWLHTWLLAPDRGLVHFHRQRIRAPKLNSSSNDPAKEAETGVQTERDNCLEEEDGDGRTILHEWIQSVRSALGVEPIVTDSTAIEPQSASYSNSTATNVTPSTGENGVGGMPGSSCGGQDLWRKHRHDLGGRMNEDADTTGFLRMTCRQHALNASNYSLSSMFSAFSCGAASAVSRAGSSRSSRCSRQRAAPRWAGPHCVRALYQLLIAPMTEYLHQQQQSALSLSDSNRRRRQRHLVLVPDNALCLVPFSVLADDGCDPVDGQRQYLCARYSLIQVPALCVLTRSRVMHTLSPPALNTPFIQSERTRPCPSRSDSTVDDDGEEDAVVMADPSLPPSLRRQWGWHEQPAARREAETVAALLDSSHPLIGSSAHRSELLHRLQSARLIHLAVHVSWQLSALVLAPTASGTRLRGRTGESSDDEEPADSDSQCDAGELPLSDVLVTAADILQLQLSAKLVVINWYDSATSSDEVTADDVMAACSAVGRTEAAGAANIGEGVTNVTQALLAAGAGCVMYALWPASDTANKILYRAFYSSLMQGSRVSMALSEAQRTVHATRQLAHPANWGGHVLMGSDLRVAPCLAGHTGAALTRLLTERGRHLQLCRDALRVCLHLVEKSLQRIARGHTNAMYTTQRSIENKVGTATTTAAGGGTVAGSNTGWKHLLMSVGFRFEPAAHGIASSVFFPQSDPSGRLAQCSASLQALLALSGEQLAAICRLATVSTSLTTPSPTEAARQLLRQLINSPKQLQPTSLSRTVWTTEGCHELLAALGFELVEVAAEEVHVALGRSANWRQLEFSLQALESLFDSLDEDESLDEDSETDSSESEEDTHQINDINTEAGVVSCVRGAATPPRRLPPPPPPPLALPITSSDSAPLTLGRGAFDHYVRNTRGEPDGARSVVNNNNNGSIKGNGRVIDPLADSGEAGRIIHTSSGPPPLPRPRNLPFASAEPIDPIEPAPLGVQGSASTGLSDKLSVRCTTNRTLRSKPTTTTTTAANVTPPGDHSVISALSRRSTAAVNGRALCAPAIDTPPVSVCGTSVQEHIIATQMNRLRMSADTGYDDQHRFHQQHPPKRGSLGMAPPLSQLLVGTAELTTETRRDEGDGRSMTDSNYSGYSPSHNQTTKPATDSSEIQKCVAEPPAEAVRGRRQRTLSWSVSGKQQLLLSRQPAAEC